MKLENQVCSLDSAKKLKELKVKQDSLFYWVEFYNSSSTEPTRLFVDLFNDDELGELKEKSYITIKGQYSAFTVSELGEMLPNHLLVKNNVCDLTIIHSSVWRFYYGDIYFTAGSYDTEAEARAKMLIYLLENKLD